ncbi:alpha/beta fold hydrolase [Nocardioides panacisoli]|uniref:AB hydrolase-1 domain-containing protein n=1 Tax=Nocardioides panacisoli TaxID=627624 RepID=A0ABP7IFR5_9ACTN
MVGTGMDECRIEDERIQRVNGVDLCSQAFGEPSDPAVLLIAGRDSSMDWWEDDFCRRLAVGGRYVVRYDLRDTGRSTTYPAGEPDYSFADLVDDAVGILDAREIASAHVVGISMGGALAQWLGVLHRDRVESLTLVDTSGALPGMPDDLPPPEPELADYFRSGGLRPEDATDTAAVVEHVVEGQRAFARGPFDEDRWRSIATRVVQRMPSVPGGLGNHGVMRDCPSPDAGLGEITVPTLVVHGTADPLFPLPHGRALARAIPGATLLPLEGVGHEAPPPSTWDVVVPALLRLTGNR